jgi:predicted negative regulator of RcsB-dependent stress response
LAALVVLILVALLAVAGVLGYKYYRARRAARAQRDASAFQYIPADSPPVFSANRRFTFVGGSH